MSQSLTLELNEQVFVAIQRQAQAIGISPAQLAATLLERQFPQVKLFLDEAEKTAARSKFERHFRTLEIGSSVDLDNESIDADFALTTDRHFEQEGFVRLLKPEG